MIPYIHKIATDKYLGVKCSVGRIQIGNVLYLTRRCSEETKAKLLDSMEAELREQISQMKTLAV